MYENRIKHLEEAHHSLNRHIDGLEKTGVFGDLELENLKKQRLHLKDEIVILKHRQAIINQSNDKK